MPLNREDAYRALASWNPAPIFLEAFDGHRLPENLDIFFGVPEELFLNPETTAIDTPKGWIPILDDGNLAIVTYHDFQRRALVQRSLEAPDLVVASFDHWQQYLGHLMLRIGEAIDDDERIHRISEILRFRYLEELFQFWTRSNGLPVPELGEARKEFIEKLRD